MTVTGLCPTCMGADVSKCQLLAFIGVLFFVPTMEKIKIEYIKIESLKSSDYNPRKWNSNTVDKMVKSIKSYDMIDPLIVYLQGLSLKIN